MRAICTTVIRGANQYEFSGRIIEIDLTSGQIVMAMHLPNKGQVLGPRGGSRGGRGVRVFGQKIYVAIYDRILVYDFDWNLVSEIKHPYVVGHHEIQVDVEGVWCTTMMDSVVKLDFSGRVLFEWWGSEDDDFVAWLSINRHAWDRTENYDSYEPPAYNESYPGFQCHFNSVYCVDGKVYVYDLSHQALFAVWPRFEPLARVPAWNRAHNVHPRGQDILVNVSGDKRFEIWRMPMGMHKFWRRKPYRTHQVVVVPGPEQSTQFSRSGWVRGLIELGPQEFIVGCNPAGLHHLKDGRVVQSWPISDEVNEAVHGLTLKPC
ncbi:MAG: hypothetical protein KDI79_31350 [Anaerolineae bacterium]|nr:hypothetical protein [Anaerolineae bacterium]